MTASVCVSVSSQSERRRRTTAAVRSRSDVSDTARQYNAARRHSDCTDDDIDSEHAPLPDDAYDRRPADHIDDFCSYKVIPRKSYRFVTCYGYCHSLENWRHFVFQS